MAEPTVLDANEAATLLGRLITGEAMGKADTGRIRTLLSLLAQSNRIPMLDALTRLFPDSEPSAAEGSHCG